MHSRIDISLFRAAIVAILIPYFTGCDRGAAEPVAPRITVFSGNNQQVPDGSRLAEPLAARVTGVGGRPASGVEVVWQVDHANGEFRSYPDEQTLTPATSVTDSMGVARIYFLPKVLGASVITASATGLTQTRAAFVATDKPNVEIFFGPMFDCTPLSDTSTFSANRSTELSAPVNAKVGIGYASSLHPSCTARIRTVSVPEGAEPFDSGIISPGQVFVFTPRVAGVWEFADVINGGSGRLTVH